MFEPMLAEARRLLADDRVPPERQRIETRLDMRYVGQSYELPIPTRPGFSRRSGRRWCRRFHAEHARRFGHSDPAAPVEIVSFGVTATGLIDTPELPRPRQGGAEPPEEARSGTRRVLFRSARREAAATGPIARCGSARRCSPATGSPDRRSSRKSRRRRCSIPGDQRPRR